MRWIFADTNSLETNRYPDRTSQVLGGLSSLLIGGLSAALSASPLSASKRGMIGSQKPGEVDSSDNRRFHVIGGEKNCVTAVIFAYGGLRPPASRGSWHWICCKARHRNFFEAAAVYYVYMLQFWKSTIYSNPSCKTP